MARRRLAVTAFVVTMASIPTAALGQPSANLSRQGPTDPVIKGQWGWMPDIPELGEPDAWGFGRVTLLDGTGACGNDSGTTTQGIQNPDCVSGALAP